MNYDRIKELKKEGLTYGGLYALLMLYRNQAPELMAFIEEAFLIECGYLDKDSLLTDKGEALAIEFEKSVLDILDVYNKDIDVIPTTPMKSSSMNDTPTLIASAMVNAVEKEFGKNIKDAGTNFVTGLSDRASLIMNLKTFILKEVPKLKEIEEYKNIDFSTHKTFVDATLRYMKHMKDNDYNGIQLLSRFVIYTDANKEKRMKIIDYLIEKEDEHQEDYY